LADGRGLDPSELATASYLQGLQRGIEERHALDYQNIGLAAMQRNWALAGEARMPSSALNYPNEYLRMLRQQQQQQQQQQLFLLQMQSLADRQGVESADPGSLCTAGTLCFINKYSPCSCISLCPMYFNFNALGLNRVVQGGAALQGLSPATIVNAQSAISNPKNLTQILVRDRLRYYNNGIEGD
jgi:hypothetical protein